MLYIKLAAIIPFILFIATMIVAKASVRDKIICVMWWIVFPFVFPYQVKRYNVIRQKWKSWLLVLVSPLFLCFYVLVGFIIITGILIGGESCGVPSQVEYHTAEDLHRATGVEFPEVVPVDSLYYDSWTISYVQVKFVPTEELSESFLKRLEQACKEDSCCWAKNEEEGYVYHIYPERPLDRTKGTHIRMIMVDGQSLPDWDGDYVRVVVPLKGDTITIEDGWRR